jgi:hypothetical protein
MHRRLLEGLQYPAQRKQVYSAECETVLPDVFVLLAAAHEILLNSV